MRGLLVRDTIKSCGRRKGSGGTAAVALNTRQTIRALSPFRPGIFPDLSFGFFGVGTSQGTEPPNPGVPWQGGGPSKVAVEACCGSDRHMAVPTVRCATLLAVACCKDSPSVSIIPKAACFLAFWLLFAPSTGGKEDYMAFSSWAAGQLGRIGLRVSSFARHLNDPVLMGLRKRRLPRECYQLLNHKWLKAVDFRTILDVGANTGQFAVAANAIFPRAAIYSFEPLPDCFQTLRRNMSGVGEFRAFNVAIGAARGELQFNRSSFAPSSSFRQMAVLHKEVYPWTAGIEKVNVQVETLDSITAKLELADPILLKIDVQGFEDQVLLGGKDTARKAAMIIVETSFETLYEGQPLFDDIYRMLTDWGFSFQGNLEQTLDAGSGRPLYADGVFVRNGRGPLQAVELCG